MEESLQLTKNTPTGLFGEQETDFNCVKPLVLWGLFVIAASITITQVEYVGVGEADHGEPCRCTVKILSLSLNKMKSHCRILNKGVS